MRRWNISPAASSTREGGGGWEQWRLKREREREEVQPAPGCRGPRWCASPAATAPLPQQRSYVRARARDRATDRDRDRDRDQNGQAESSCFVHVQDGSLLSSLPPVSPTKQCSTRDVRTVSK